MDRPKSLFLLYVSVMLVITFLQQEFVLLPDLQSVDLVGEETKSQMLEKWQRWRWVSFLFVPLILALRLSLVTLCLYIGGFFFVKMSGHQFKNWWEVALKAQAVILANSVMLCVVNIMFGPNKAIEVTTYTSLLFLGGENIDQWLKIPLSAVNVFEILYWVVMSFLVGKMCGTRFESTFKFVLSTYGVGYLFYIALLMFLMLYLT